MTLRLGAALLLLQNPPAGRASAGDSVCNHQNCPGGDIPWANPLPATKGWTLANCSAKCNATAGCVGWVYQGSDAGPACGGDSGDGNRCYLKERNMGNCGPLKCTCAGTNGRAPAPPAPPPPPPPPPPRCDTCTQTTTWVGGEWHPANASNSLWMSPAFVDGYLDGEVDVELASASAVGLTALRVFMHNMAYDASPTHFLASIERFLTMAHGHGLGVGFVFFDDCWNHAGASTTTQCQERDGLHNACSMASPQDFERTNTSRFKPYVTDIIRAHAKDPRVLWWGMFNEPRNSGFSLELRHAAYAWAKALNPIQPVISCWNGPGNNDTDLQNIHHYDANFQSLTDQSWAGLALKQGSLVTEAGCRWFQGESSSSGSPLEMLNWATAMKADPHTPYVPGVMLSWTVIVGNDNTRWHWGSRQGTPEPAIPWCGLIWPDGLPVSYTEAHAIAEYTRNGAKQPSAGLPRQLWAQTFLPQTLTELRSAAYGPTFLSISSNSRTSPTAINLNSTAPADDDVLIELTIWPTWSKLSESLAVNGSEQAVGVLVHATAARLGARPSLPQPIPANNAAAAAVGIFAGVTADGHVILEEWMPNDADITPATAQRKLLGSFDLATLPPNQEHAAVDGWNMLRLRLRRSSPVSSALSAVGGNGGAMEASIWWNPTHADSPGVTRGLRLNATVSGATAMNLHAAKIGDELQLSAAVRGGASAKIDYIGVYAA